MSQDTPPTREDQLVAALCHAAILMPLIGIAVPLAVWLSQRERSLLLRKHGLQALAFQLSGLALYVLANICQVGSFVFLVPAAFVPTGSSGTAPATVSPLLLVFPAIFIVGQCISFLLQCVGWPAYILFGVRAAWQIAHGHAYDYPLLGSWLSRHTAVPSVPPSSVDSHATGPGS